MISCKPIRLALVAATVLGLTLTLAACESATLKANEQQVQQQQAQIEQNQMEIQKMLAQRQSYGAASSASASVPIASAGGCDKAVMAEATRHGGDKLSAGDFSHAIGYYQDALTACPNNPRAELNLAHAYEAAGNRSAAIDHFRIAARSTNPAGLSAEEEARNALVRLGSN